MMGNDAVVVVFVAEHICEMTQHTTDEVNWNGGDRGDDVPVCPVFIMAIYHL